MIAWEAAAGPTVHRQGSRCARPAPPACGLDCAPLARLFAAMRSWLACAIAPKLQRKREVAALQRDMAWSSAVLWIGQACHTGAMAPAQESRRRRVPADASHDDLYDYVAAPARPGLRRANRASVTLTVTDNLPEDVPVTEAEIAVFEAWFGELFDELFGDG